MKTYKLTYITSVYTRYYTRIFVKMCFSLASNQYNLFLLVADGKGDEEKKLINFYENLVT